MRQEGRLILASASPRRRVILEQLGVSFEVMPSDVDESVRASEAAADYVLRLALEKAQAAVAFARGAAVLAADTTVALGPEIFGKPGDVAEARRMVFALSGRTHSVFTGVAVLSGAGGVFSAVAETQVSFREFSEDEARRYAESGEGLDKAGAYAVQGLGAGLVRELRGSYSNVVGLPAAETLELLERAGVLREWP